MFQTEINHFLQSFAFDELTLFMQLMTSLGYLDFFLVLITFLVFAVDFKKGFILLMILLWTGSITYFFKHYFALPRPFHVDNTVKLLDRQLPDPSTFSFSQRGANSFFSTLDADILEGSRKAKDIEYGFPSGHTSIAVTLWLAMALLFRKRWLTILCLGLVILIPLSRMYLGVHFLADVIGGYILGGILLLLLWILMLHPSRFQPFLELPRLTSAHHTLSLFLVLSPFFLMLLVPVKLWTFAAYAFGFGIGFYFLGRKGFPNNTGSIGQRVWRFLLVAALMLLVKVTLKSIFLYTGFENTGTDFVRHFVEGLVFIWGATELLFKINWIDKYSQTTKKLT